MFLSTLPALPKASESENLTSFNLASHWAPFNSCPRLNHKWGSGRLRDAEMRRDGLQWGLCSFHFIAIVWQVALLFHEVLWQHCCPSYIDSWQIWSFKKWGIIGLLGSQWKHRKKSCFKNCSGSGVSGNTERKKSVAQEPVEPLHQLLPANQGSTSPPCQQHLENPAVLHLSFKDSQKRIQFARVKVCRHRFNHALQIPRVKY